jgi:hypothetical protein
MNALGGGRRLSSLERGMAVCLSAVCIAAGGFGLIVAVEQVRWVMGAVALVAVAYGVARARVALFSRLLTWPKLFTPWRSGKPRG